MPATCLFDLFDTKIWSMSEAEVWCIRVGLLITGKRLLENIVSRYVLVSSCWAKFKMLTLKSETICISQFLCLLSDRKFCIILSPPGPTISPHTVVRVVHSTSRGFGKSDGSVISSLLEQINNFLYNLLTCPFNGTTLGLAGGRVGRGPARNGEILVFLFFAVHFEPRDLFIFFEK